MRDELPEADALERLLPADAGVRGVAFDSQGISAWDTGLPVFMRKLQNLAARRGMAVDLGGLPEGARRLLVLAAAVPPRAEGPTARRTEGLLARVGEGATRVFDGAGASVTFLGEVTLATLAGIRGQARYRRADFWLILQSVGPQALAIVSLISFLVGVILAFVGSVQLARFGAQIYIADLVGLAMAREMGPIMAAIIMAGRTGAAFAAQIGTMQVNQEIDALKTLGISPVEFLVLPRVVALMLAMPLLTLYADLVGIVGGFAVTVGMFHVTPTQYYNETIAALTVTQFAIGVVKGSVFGALVALAGCLRGVQSGRSASAVGDAATSAVVSGIVAIIVTDGLFAVALNVLGL